MLRFHLIEIFSPSPFTLLKMVTESLYVDNAEVNFIHLSVCMSVFVDVVVKMLTYMKLEIAVLL
jgi:hypothetical protein